MSKWLKQCRLELRMILRNPLFALLPVVYNLIFLFFIFSIQAAEKPGTFGDIFEFNAILHTLSLGPVMLLGIISVRRDIGKPSFEWNRSLPISFSMMMSAKYIVGQLYLLLFTLPAYTIMYFSLVRQPVPAEAVWRQYLQLMLQSEISYLVTLALAMLLAVCIGGRVVYLIGFCAWMFGTFFMDIFLISQMGWDMLRTFHLNQFFLSSDLMSGEIWGYDLYQSELAISWRFVLAFTVLMLVVSLLLINLKRPTMWIKWWWLGAFMSVLIAAAGLNSYLSLWQERSSAIREMLADPTLYSASSAYAADPSIPEVSLRPTISSYDISLKRRDDDRLQLSARMTIPASSWNKASVFPMTLHRDFHVERVNVKGNQVEYRRQGDQLSLVLPRDASGELEVIIEYFGKPGDYLPRETKKRSLFSIGGEVKLPSYMAWYPLAGEQSLYFKHGHPDDAINRAVSFRRMLFPPVDFSLTVEGYPNPVYASIREWSRDDGIQRFKGEQVEGVTLLGSRNLIQYHSPDIPAKMITTPYNMAYAQTQLEDFAQKYKYFSSWVSEMPKQDVQVFYSDSGYDVNPYNGYMESDLIISPVYYYYDFDVNSLPGEWMNALLFGNQNGFYRDGRKQQEDVRNVISSLFWYMYYREEKGLTDIQIEEQYSWARSVQFLFGWVDQETDPDKIRQKMVSQVAKAMKEGKTTQVKALLNEFYSAGLRLPDKQEAVYRPEEPVTYTQWQQRWNEIVESPGGK
ncbi:ABC transporter permease/M1 family aminopeptidase [Paenibacillus lemnae]|uniref:ABC transporter permease n=1 Tax=Paenibacillus lemnae TaxID=1330551 RepID=A0A848MCT0_PAELE|nr:ABC transporter permease [Paenibacillus lemnae]NMO97244.1 ABC transporter permease [Paenibacillus lemnae]